MRESPSRRFVRPDRWLTDWTDYMVDTQSCSGRFLLLDLWTLWATRLRVVDKSTGLFCVICQRFVIEALVFRVDEAELEVGEANEPFAVVGLGDPDRLASEHPADEDQFTTPLDLAIRTHAAYCAVVAIERLAQGTWVGTWRGLVERGRRLEAQGLVRAIDIELCAKAVERVLLRSQCRGRRVGSVVLECIS